MPSTLFILALDCSTARGSLALADASGTVRWRAEVPAGRGHGGELFGALEAAMGEIRAAGGSLGGIVVGLGPGSYSGVRQSIAAAVGLSVATGASLGGVPSAAALAPAPAAFQAVGDARRGAFYYTAVRAGVCVAGPELLPDADALCVRLSTYPDWPVLAVETDLLPDAAPALPDAARLLAIPRATHREPPLEPIYLRPVSITLLKPAKPRVP